MSSRDAWEYTSFVVTAPGRPLAIICEPTSRYRIQRPSRMNNVPAPLLRGEDPQFRSYLRRIAEEERGALIQPS